MSLPIANQMYKTLISVKECQNCSQYSYEFVGNIAIPFCKKRWYGEKCVRESDEPGNSKGKNKKASALIKEQQ